MNKEDVVDLVWDAVEGRRVLPQSKRIFLSEYEIKRMIGTGKLLKVPVRAIVSPLAEDWLILKKIQVIRED